MPQFFADTFSTGTAGTAIQSRTPEKGTWALLAGTPNTVLTAAGRARPGGSGFPTYFANVTPANADYEVQATFFFASVVGLAGVYARVDTTGANDYSIYWDTGAAKWTLGKDVASAGTVLASSATPAATASSVHTALLRVHGTSIAAWVDDVLIGSVTDASTAAANRAGFFQNGSATPSDSLDVHFDNYLVSDTPMPPTPAVWHNPLLPQ